MKPGRKTDEFVRVTGAPTLRGLSFRRVLEKPDFEELAGVIQKSRDADLIEIVETPRDLAEDFNHLQNCLPEKDMLYAYIGDEMIGFCRCEWHRRADGERTYDQNAYLVPEWRVRGLRRAMVRYNERRLREVASGHPRSVAKVFEARANAARNSWKSLLIAEGYRTYRHNLQMIRSTGGQIPDLALPEDLEIRPYRKKDLRKIFDAAHEAFREEPNYTEEFWSEDALKTLVAWRSFQPDIWITAWSGEQVAGGVMNIIDDIENKKYGRNWGYIAAVFVRRPHRHKGLASALIARSLDLLREEGVSEGVLGVDAENPTGARRVYERLGFRVFDDYARYRKPLRLRMKSE